MSSQVSEEKSEPYETVLDRFQALVTEKDKTAAIETANQAWQALVRKINGYVVEKQIGMAVWYASHMSEIEGKISEFEQVNSALEFAAQNKNFTTAQQEQTRCESLHLELVGLFPKSDFGHQSEKKPLQQVETFEMCLARFKAHVNAEEITAAIEGAKLVRQALARKVTQFAEARKFALAAKYDANDETIAAEIVQLEQAAQDDDSVASYMNEAEATTQKQRCVVHLQELMKLFSDLQFVQQSQAAEVKYQAAEEKVDQLPPGWGMYTDPKTQKKYYANPTTGESSWDPPAQVTPLVYQLAQLNGMTLKDLKNMAREKGIGNESIDDCDDNDCPKRAVIDLILAQQARHGALRATFTPGQLGFRIRQNTGVVEEVREGSQADRLGVQPDMVIETIDGHAFSAPFLVEKTKGSDDYEIIFSKASQITTNDPQDEENVCEYGHSMGSTARFCGECGAGAKAQKTGTHIVAYDSLPVGESREFPTAEVARLSEGTTVEVLEVSKEPIAGQIRVRIASPAGWITAKMADGSCKYIQVTVNAENVAPFQRPTHRFKVGDSVLCRTGEFEWTLGDITELDYVNPRDPDMVYPYLVMTPAGGDIFVPQDVEHLCKKYIPAWWENLLKRDELSATEGIELLKNQSIGEDVNARNHDGDCALHCALGRQWPHAVEALLELRADPNLAGKLYKRPLNMAVDVGFEVVLWLLDAKADPCLQDEDPDKDPDLESKTFQERRWHRSALHYAAMSSLDITQLLIDGRADINQLDAQYKQPLHLAIEERVEDVIDLLVRSRADVNAGNISLGLNSTPLIDAACRNDLKLVELLVNAKSDVNRQGKQGMTALHMAVRGKRPQTAKLLVSAKADVSIKAAGKTAAQLAVQNGMRELLNILDPSRDKENDCAPEHPVTLDDELRKQLFID